jgi:hypothetical protein
MKILYIRNEVAVRPFYVPSKIRTRHLKFIIVTCIISGFSGRAVYGRKPTAIVGSNPTGGMDVCLLCVLSGSVLCDELITRPEGPTECGASLCVIKKPRGRGGHCPRWAA